MHRAAPPLHPGVAVANLPPETEKPVPSRDTAFSHSRWFRTKDIPSPRRAPLRRAGTRAAPVADTNYRSYRSYRSYVLAASLLFPKREYSGKILSNATRDLLNAAVIEDVCTVNLS